ncbi:MAG: DUF4870 domain-containing protein [Actinomycetota bacterium]
MWSHLSPLLISAMSFVLSFFAVGFLLIYFAWVPTFLILKSNKSDDFIASNAKEAINLQIDLIVIFLVGAIFYVVFGVLTLGIGFIVGGLFSLFLFLLLTPFVAINQIRASKAAANGRRFTYPLLPFRFLK